MNPAAAVYDDALMPRLAVGAILSVLAHAALLAMVVAREGSLAAAPPRLLNPPAAEFEPPPTPVGIQESRAVSINWLGFADPTEHHAVPAETEQAEMSPEDPGVPIAAAEPAPEPSEAEPEELALETTDEAAPEAEPVELAEEAAPSEAETGAEAAQAPSPLAVLEEASAATTERLFRFAQSAATRARALAAQAELAAQRAARHAAAESGDAPDAIEAEKDSDATSMDEVLEWSPGRPLAAQGLDIKTDRPRWATTTRLWASPRNPVVRIEFRKNGVVARAAFLDGHDTGNKDVDGPLLDAIYRWTATGKALDELPAGDPNARVSITMQVILVPERGTLRRTSPKD